MYYQNKYQLDINIRENTKYKIHYNINGFLTCLQCVNFLLLSLQSLLVSFSICQYLAKSSKIGAFRCSKICNHSNSIFFLITKPGYNECTLIWNPMVTHETLIKYIIMCSSQTRAANYHGLKKIKIRH